MFLLHHLLPALFGEGAGAAERGALIASMQATYDTAMADLADVDEEVALSDGADDRERPPFDFPA